MGMGTGTGGGHLLVSHTYKIPPNKNNIRVRVEATEPKLKFKPASAEKYELVSKPLIHNFDSSQNTLLSHTTKHGKLYENVEATEPKINIVPIYFKPASA